VATVETWAVVVAAGEGTRLGSDLPKAFVGLGGRPLLAHAIELLDDHPAVDRIVLVVPEDWQEPATLLADELVAGKVADAVPGGATRAHSVAAGLARIPAEAAVVLVHDAARPLAGADVVDRVLAGLVDADGAVPGVPVTDTVKRVARGRVESTLERSALVAVQTPQEFRAEALRTAYAAAADPASATDCASLLEQAGLPVAVVEGDPRNIKVTTAADLERAEAELAR
jgi:2-C-methyl-D-erythritol 4-phosphate cytidylyltransferase